jgi:hypothetical protein
MMIPSVATDANSRTGRFSTWDAGRYSELADIGASHNTVGNSLNLETKTRILSMANCSVSGGVVFDFKKNDDDGTATTQEEMMSMASVASKQRDRTVSIILLLITDVVATLQGTLLKILLGRGISLFVMLFITSLIGAMFAGCIMLIRGTPFVKEKCAFKAMIERGVLGGLANLCAFYAVSQLNLGVASCLMFTMPLWTALLSYLVAGQIWDKVDIILAVSCLCGVVLVTEIWTVDEGVEALGDDQHIHPIHTHTPLPIDILYTNVTMTPCFVLFIYF